MTLNELVFNNINGLEDFVIAQKTIKGSYKNIPLDLKLYEKLYNKEVENFYLDINTKDNKPFIVVTLEDY